MSLIYVSCQWVFSLGLFIYYHYILLLRFHFQKKRGGFYDLIIFPTIVATHGKIPIQMARRHAPIVAKGPADFYSGTRRFCDDALHIICFSALYSNFSPALLAMYLRGDLNEKSRLVPPPVTTMNDLLGVHPREVRACFYKMLDENHGIYSKWRNHPSFNAVVDDMLTNVKASGREFKFQDRRNISMRFNTSIWGRGSDHDR